MLLHLIITALSLIASGTSGVLFFVAQQHTIQMQEIHLMLNSRLDQLVQLNRELARAAGREEAIQEALNPPRDE